MRKLINRLHKSTQPLTLRQARFRLLRDLCGLFIIAVALLYATQSVIENEQAQRRETEKRRAFEHMSAMRATIEQRIQANVLVLHALKPEIFWQDTPDRQRLQNVIDEFLDTNLDIRHLALAPDLKVSFIYPSAGNEDLIGLDYRQVGNQYHEILRAIARQDILLSSPVHLLQGGTALIARLPIFQADGSFWGIASLVIDQEHFFTQVGFYDHPEYQFFIQRRAISGATEPVAGFSNTLTNDPIFTHIQVPGDTWELAVAPRGHAWIPADQRLWQQWLVGGALTATIVFAFLILIMTQHRLRKAVHTISYQARFDPLTDLSNRYYFQQQLEAHIIQSHRQEQGFALVMLDLDHLRDINDALGQDIGDELLRHAAQRLQSNLTSADLIARVGGDEFAVVFANSEELADIETRAKALIAELMRTVSIRRNPINVTASAGIALFPQDAIAAQQLIKHAEVAMYAAKATGSLSVSFFDEQLRRDTEQHIALHHEMVTALEQQQFHVEYQPVITTESGKVARCEALIRWQHPERGLIPPSDFIPIAEKSGAIVALGEFVLAQVLKDWQEMRAQGLDITVAVNRSPREFNDKDVAFNWLSALQKHQMPADRLMLEITESMLMRNKERQLFNLHRLRAAGVHLAIDDFGTGYSSLNYLRSYPIDVIKIDRGFLREVPNNRRQTALVSALIQIAQTLDMVVVAEGVETAAQANFLRDKGCHYQQGFYYGQNMRLEAFIAFCKKHNWRVSR